MIARLVLVVSALFAVGVPIQQQPPRDPLRSAAGTASLSGIVLVNGDPAAPARRVRVTLRELSGAVPGQTTTTDDRGSFTFRGLPAGRFELQAFKNVIAAFTKAVGDNKDKVASLDQLKAALPQVGNACNDCHELYRRPQ